MNFKKITSIVSVVLIAALLIYGIKLYRDIFSDNTKITENEFFVHIPSDATYEDVKKIISPFIENMDYFEMVDFCLRHKYHNLCYTLYQRHLVLEFLL